MLTNVQIRRPYDVFSFDDTHVDMAVGVPGPYKKYIIKSIDGLGPVKADLSTSKRAGTDGMSLDSSSLGGRNIVMTIDYRPDFHSGETIQDVRRALYVLAGPKKMIDLVFTNDNPNLPTLTITGIVETHEPSLFDRSGAVTISVVCVNPYFRAAEVMVSGEAKIDIPITYSGDVPTGVRMSIQPSGQNIYGFEFQISPLPYEPGMIFKTEGPIPTPAVISNGKKIWISTVSGDRYVREMAVNFPTVSKLRYLTNSVWPQLMPGENILRIREVDPYDILIHTVVNVWFTPLYEGM